MLDAAADREGVNRALERLLAWPDIARSPQLARFLAYIVDLRLKGDTQSIKAYSIAVDVFGRPPDFDPQADPIVRVQARRLRSLLDQYYRGPGAEEDLRIELPIGRYVPEFVAQTPETRRAAGDDTSDVGRVDRPSAQEKPLSTGPPRGHVTVSWFVLLVLALGAAALTYALSTWEPRREQQILVSGAMLNPTLRIMEFQNLTGDATLTSYISALAIELVTDFAPFSIVDVSFGGRGDVEIPPDNADGYVLTGIVRNDPTTAGRIQVSAILTDLLTNNIVWNRSVSLPREQMTQRGGVEYVAQELVTVLGGARGPLHARARELLGRTSISGQENLYLCTMLFSLYRGTSSTGAAERFNACLNALPERDRQTGNMVAALASLTAETGIGGQAAGARQMERMSAANDLMATALRIAPTSSFVWEQRARIHEVQGLHDEAQAAYGTALQLNPANVDAIAANARHLALIGRLDEAVPAAQRAIEAVPITGRPDWYYCVPAIATLKAERFADALRHAQNCARADVELGSVLALMAAQGMGDATMVSQQLTRILDLPSFRSAGVITQLRRRVGDSVLLEEMRRAMVGAGVPVQSLIAAY